MVSCLPDKPIKPKENKTNKWYAYMTLTVKNILRPII